MVVDYFKYDFELAEPPRVCSLQNSVPNPTFTDFGDDEYFVADQRGYEAVVYYLAGQYLKTDGSGKIVDPRLQLNKVYNTYMLAFFLIRCRLLPYKLHIITYIVCYLLYKLEQITCMSIYT